MAEKVKVGFIGSGGIAGAHLKGLAKMEDVRLVAFCDVVKERADKMVEEYGGRAFRDAKEMFDGVEMDAVFICLPPFAHGEAELLAVERGVPFFVEKPIGNDLAVCRKIEKAVGKANLLTSVGYMTRYRRSVRRAREILKDDQAVLVHGGWIGGPPSGTAPIHQWWIQKDKSGGQFVEQTTHTVDLVRYLCGEAQEVFAYATKGFNKGIPNYTIEDASMVNIKLKSGAVANIYSSCAVSNGGGVTLTVYATEHAFFFTGWDHSVRIVRPGNEVIEIKGEGDIFSIEDRAFLDAVKTGERSLVLSDYADGLKTAEITLAANESMETGRPVKVGG